MKISVENPEALRVWLTNTLLPICDADPQALAKYVLALVKKEKEEQELKDVCVEQLDVFLQEKTKEFVETLFVTLKDKSYLPPPPPPPPIVEVKKEPTPPPPPPIPPPAPPTPPRDPPREPGSYTTHRKSPPPKQADSHRDDNKPVEDLRNRLSHKDEPRRRSRSPYRERSPLRNRSPLRGRSPPRRRGGVFDRLDRRRFSPERGRPRYSSRHSPDRKRRSPPLRKSPGRSPLRRSPGRSPLRRSPGRSPIRRSPGRSPLRRSPGRSPLRRSQGRSPVRRSPGRSPLRRSPIRSPNRRSPVRRSPRGRSPLPPRGRSPLSRGKSRSPDSRLVKRSDNKGPRSLSRERLPRSRSRTPPPRRRFRPRSWSMSSSGLSDSLSPKGRSPDSRGSTPRDYSPYNRTTNTRDFKPSGRVRCKDYDEKGFCMKGDLCQYDHGNDPVVVDDVNLPNVLQLNQSGPPPPPVPPGLQPPVIHQRPPGPGGQQMIGGPRGPPPPPGQPPLPHMQPHPPMGPRPMMRGPMPHPHPGQRPIIRPGFPGINLLHMKGATPPPPGTVPIRMPPQGFTQGPPPLPAQRPAFAPEPYNPEAPAISAVNSQSAYVPTQIVTRPQQVSAHQRLGPVNNNQPSPPTGKPQDGGPGGLNLVNISTAEEQQQQGPVVNTVEVGPSVASGAASRTVLLGKRENDGSSAISNGNSGEPANKKPAFDKSRLGGTGAKNFSNNNTLELRKIPREMNNILSLNQHFSKFGLITNLQIAYNGDPEGAIVSFASPAQAKAAYRCTEPIFNNRFVRVFWHNPTDENTKPQLSEKKMSIKDRLGMIPPAHKMSLNNVNKTSAANPEKESGPNNPTGLTKTVFNPEALKKQNVHPAGANVKTTAKPPSQQQQHHQQQPTPQQRESQLLARKQEVLKKKLEIQKKKQQLLQEQLKQQKILIGKLESNKSISAEDRNSILKTIKVLADSIEKLKHELLASSQQHQQQQPKQQPQKQQRPKPQVTLPEKTEATVKKVEEEEASQPVPKTPTTPDEQKKALLQHKQQAQKAILDTELDIINKSYEGADTSELRQKVARLKEEAMSLGLLGRGRGLPPSGGGVVGAASVVGGFPRGRGGGAGRGRGSYALSHVLDRRPKQLVVMGFLLEEKEEVLKHLGGYGEIESVIGDDTVPSVNINFKTRQGAEVAAREGQGFKKKRLVMMWHKPESSSEVSSTQGNEAENTSSQPSVEESTAETGSQEELDTLVVGASDSAELEGLDEAALLGLDEEEDGEADRSWKP